MSNNINTIETLDTSPFKRLVLSFGGVPADFKESMTYYELLAWLCNYLEKEVLPKVNETAEKYNELITAFNTLKDYVDNYFDNLDVQEEINNKLDEMAESGELGPIIAEYFDHSVIVRNTLADFTSDESFTSEGLTIKTLGYHSINDGGGAYYYTRTKTEADTDNGGSIIFLQNNLVGVLLNTNGKVNVKQFGAYGDGTHDDATSINNAIAYIKANISILNTLFFPVGKYRVNDDINDIDFPLQIEGESTSNLIGYTGTGTAILDTRTNTTPLFTYLAPEGEYEQGQAIRSIELTTNLTTAKKCLHFEKVGWDLILDTISITNYKGNAITFNGTNDAYIQNCSILACGSYQNDTVYYAIEEGGNAHHYDNCHFEHCPYIIHETSISFHNRYTGCKFENGNADPYKSLNSQIKLESPTYGSEFNGCLFTMPNCYGYYNYFPSLSPSDIPFYIDDNNNARTIITNCQAQPASRGTLPDQSPYNITDARFYKGGNYKTITNNNISGCSVSVPFMIINRATVTGNTFIGKARNFNGHSVLDGLLSNLINGTRTTFTGNNFWAENDIDTRVIPCINGSNNLISGNYVMSATHGIITSGINNNYITPYRYAGGQQMFDNYPFSYFDLCDPEHYDRLSVGTNTTVSNVPYFSRRINISAATDVDASFQAYAPFSGLLHFKYISNVSIPVTIRTANAATDVGTLIGDGKMHEFTANKTVANAVRFTFYTRGMSGGEQITIIEPYAE